MAELRGTKINVEANNLTTTEPTKTRVEPNNLTTTKLTATRVEPDVDVNPPIKVKTNKRTIVEKEILQHLLSLEQPEELRLNQNPQEAKDMENLDYAQEFPAIMVRPVTPKIHPEPKPESKSESNNQARPYDINNGIHDNDNSENKHYNLQETKKPAVNNTILNFAAALAKTEVKKQEAGRVKVVIHKDETRLKEQKSVFISRLPIDVTIQQLVFALRKFGGVKVGSITIRRPNNISGRFCYAFAEFQCSQHATEAVKASKFTIGAAQAYISYKK